MVNAEYQREVINQAAFDMLVLCKSQLKKAKEAFILHDEDLAEEVIHTEIRVNAMDLRIGRDCEKFLALYNPVAIDLRFIMAVLKINSDLERIADHARNISNYVIEDNKKISSHLIQAVQFEKMYQIINSMLDNITFAYNQNDVKAARKVFKKDKILDKINIKSFCVLEEEIRKDNTIIKEALLLFSVVKKLERVGDLIKNIAEEIIFYVDAEVLKHTKKK
ncbi:MAG: phosphate transport system regulatory protein PhoU [Flavobacteriaceae bacterium]|nr:MAG: phosphate transport system regulatory protein PhoU [Flavobacteriaceae bacterium]